MDPATGQCTKLPPGKVTPIPSGFDPNAALMSAYNQLVGNQGQATANLGGLGTVGSVTGGGGNVNTVVPTTGGAVTNTPRQVVGAPGFTYTPGNPQYFGPTGGMLPGTVPSAYNPMGNYKGPLPTQVIAQNPNLSPTILGGVQGLGYYVDRLGNKILSPGGNLGFAEGGEVDKRDALSARRQLEALDKLTPNEQSLKRGPRSKDQGPMTGAAAPPEERSLSPAEELMRLREQYEAQSAGPEGSARSMLRRTFDRPGLSRAGDLAVKRFEKGGEVSDSWPLQVRTYRESVRDPAKLTAPLTETSLSAKELEKLRRLIDFAKANPVIDEKTGKKLPSTVDYAHHREFMNRYDPMGSAPLMFRDSDLNATESGNLRNTLGEFTYKELPDGTYEVTDTYDYVADAAESFNPLVAYAKSKGVSRPVKIRIPPAAKKKEQK